MNRKAPVNADMVSDEELTELLANAEGTTPETIDREASDLEIAPPEETTVVDVDDLYYCFDVASVPLSNGYSWITDWRFCSRKQLNSTPWRPPSTITSLEIRTNIFG